MSNRRFSLRAGLAAVAATFFLSGAAWHSLAASPSQQSAVGSQKSAANQPSSAIAHAIAGGRDSYADVVKTVAPAVVTGTTATAIEEAAPELDEVIKSSWQATITAVSGRKRMLGAFLEETRLVGVAGGTLVLAMDDLHRSVVDATEHRALVQEELSRAFGRTLSLSCTPGAANTPEQRAAKADSLKPIIDRAMEVFDGEVIERGERADRAGHGGERTS